MLLTSSIIKERLLNTVAPIPLTVNQEVKLNKEYIIMGDITVTIPDLSSTTIKNGDFIKFSKLLTATPTLNCINTKINTINGEDNTVLYNTNKVIILVFNSSLSKWEII
jgi:hypothetical protein